MGGLGRFALAVLGFMLMPALMALAAGEGRSHAPAAMQSACSSNPWIDVRCYGATGNGNSDDTAAIAAATHAAISSARPLLLAPGTYKITRPLLIDYQAQARTGFRLISMGAILDGRSIAVLPVLEVVCSGGTPTAPRGCFYFKEEGTLFIYADTANYAVVIGRRDFADAQNSIKIDHLVVNNANGGARSGGIQLNYVLGSEVFAIADTAGGAAGIALEQTQTSRISGAGSASGGGGVALLIENGYSFANTIDAIDLEVAPTCLTITSSKAAHNTFISPYLACRTGVDATEGNNTQLVNPLFAGNVKRQYASAVGIWTIP